MKPHDLATPDKRRALSAHAHGRQITHGIIQGDDGMFRKMQAPCRLTHQALWSRARHCRGTNVQRCILLYLLSGTFRVQRSEGNTLQRWPLPLAVPVRPELLLAVLGIRRYGHEAAAPWQDAYHWLYQRLQQRALLVDFVAHHRLPAIGMAVALQPLRLPGRRRQHYKNTATSKTQASKRAPQRGRSSTHRLHRVQLCPAAAVADVQHPPDRCATCDYLLLLQAHPNSAAEAIEEALGELLGLLYSVPGIAAAFTGPVVQNQASDTGQALAQLTHAIHFRFADRCALQLCVQSGCAVRIRSQSVQIALAMLCNVQAAWGPAAVLSRA